MTAAYSHQGGQLSWRSFGLSLGHRKLGTFCAPAYRFKDLKRNTYQDQEGPETNTFNVLSFIGNQNGGCITNGPILIFRYGEESTKHWALNAFAGSRCDGHPDKR